MLAINLWFLGTAICAFCAIWTWTVVIVARGRLRGLCLAYVFSAATLICFCRGLQVAPQQLFADYNLAAIINGAAAGIVICFVVLADIYAADRGQHLSFTAMSYEFFQWLAHGKSDDGGHSAIVVGGKRLF